MYHRRSEAILGAGLLEGALRFNSLGVYQQIFIFEPGDRGLRVPLCILLLGLSISVGHL